LAVGILMLCVGTAFCAEMQVVGVVYSYRPDDWCAGLGQGIRAAFSTFHKNVKTVEYTYDSYYWEKKSGNEKNKERQRLLDQIRQRKLKQIIICDDEAADLLIPDLLRQGNIKIFFTGVNRSEPEIAWLKGGVHAGLSGILERYRVPESLEILTMFKPDVRSISILTSKVETSQIITAQVVEGIRKISDAHPGRISLRKTYMLDSWTDWQTAISEIAQQDQALWLLVPSEVMGRDGKETSIETIGAYLRAHLNIPTLGITSLHTKIGVLAAVTVNPYDLGYEAGEQVVRVMNGERQEDIGIYPLQRNRFEINIVESRRLHLRIPDKLKGVVTLVDLTKSSPGK